MQEEIERDEVYILDNFLVKLRGLWKHMYTSDLIYISTETLGKE